MTAILQTNLKCIFLHGNCCIFLVISFKFENILDNFVNDVFKYLSWMETFAVFIHITFYPSALRAGGVLSSRFGRAGGRAGGCQTCGTHISVTAWRIFSIRSSMELSRPVVVHCHGNLPICPIWACPWAKNLSNLPQIGSRLCGTHISETAGWIYPIQSFMDLSRPVDVQRHSYLPICPIWACPWAKNLSNQAALGPDFAEPISLKPLDGFIPFEVLWNCLDL